MRHSQFVVNSPAWENHTWLVWVSSFPPWVFHHSNELFGRPFKSLLLLAWVRAKRRMLPPPKKRRRAVDDLDKSEDDLDESEDVIPDWHASFDLQSRAAMLPEQAWVQEALDVSTKLRARELKHVMWWDAQALNPERAALYALPHLNYTHNTGVVEFSVPPACCQPLASFLDEPSSYNVNGWLVMAGRTYPGYAKYPYVHSRFGQVSSVQEVRTRPRARRTHILQSVGN